MQSVCKREKTRGKKKIANCNLNFCRSATVMSRTSPVTTTVEDRTTRLPPSSRQSLPIVANCWACSSPGSTTPGLLLHEGSLSTINRHGWFWMLGENGVDTEIRKQPPWEYRKGTNNTTLNNTLCMLSKPRGRSGPTVCFIIPQNGPSPLYLRHKPTEHSIHTRVNDDLVSRQTTLIRSLFVLGFFY